MTWMMVVLAILVVVILVVAIGTRLTTSRIKRLDTKIAALDSGEIESLITNIEYMELTGESLKQFTKQERDYRLLIESALATLQTQLLDAETQNKQLRLVKTRKTLANVEVQLQDVQAQVVSVKKDLEAIKETEADNHARLANLREDYHAVRKIILAKSYSFGQALPALEQSLAAIDATLTGVTKATSAGDHATADQLLTEMAIQVGTLKDNVELLPPLVNTVVNEFPSQISELTSGYAALTAQHYQFDGDIPADIEAVEARVKTAHDQIEQLDIDNLTATVQTTAEAIDAVYAVMEQELAAKQAVAAQQAAVRDFIAHAKKQNKRLQLELDHLNQSYTLTHDEQADAKAFGDELAAIEAAYQETALALKAGTVVYTAVQAQFDQTQESLKAIELKQQAINQSVSDLKVREQQAILAVEGFMLTLRDVKYEVSRHQLPGLPRPYLDFYHAVTKAVQQVGRELNEIKIDMDAIAQQVAKLGADIERLKADSLKLIDAAEMTEQLLQYANRYKTTMAPVQEAATKAQGLFAQYQYQEAADTIATVLEKVEPGSYQKVEDAYLAQKSDPLF